jgi:peptide/nickel transport system substrate-binding protein
MPAKPTVLTLAMSVAGFPQLDPSNGFTTEVFIFANVYETLVRFNPPGSKERFSPHLATAWESSNGGKTWTFHLRQGVKFHDGTPFNAQAVKFTVERTKKQNGAVAYIWNAVKDIEVVDDHTVVFELSYPAPLDLVASSQYFAWMMSPSIAGKDGKWFNAGHDAGTGPYTIEKFVTGEPVVLTRFDDYWGGWRPGQFSKVVFEEAADVALRQQKLESKQVDWASDLPYENLAKFDNTPGLKVVNVPSFKTLFGALNTRKPPLNDVRVRQALLHSFPYETYISKALGGYATRSRGLIAAGMPGFHPDLKPYTFDLDKARALLKEAGYEHGFELNLTGNSEITLHRSMVELWQPALAKLGVKLNVKLLPWEAQWASTKTDPEKAQDVFLAYSIPTYVTPYDPLFIFFHTEQQTNTNWAYYSNPEFDDLIDKANEMLGSDPAKAEQMFKQSQQLLNDDAVALLAGDTNSIFVVNSDLKGYVPNPAYDAVVFAYELSK